MVRHSAAAGAVCERARAVDWPRLWLRK